MHRDRSTPSLAFLAIYIIVAVAILAAVLSVAPAVRATDEPIDLDKNAANGEESKVSTKVVNTYPVEIENTVTNNAAGDAFDFKWSGAGPGGFNSFVTPGPGVGTIWLWSSVYQVYAIESPITFSPKRSLPVFGGSSDGVDPVGTGNNGSFTVPGRSIYPSTVTLSDASLSASWISFFSPEQTRAICGTQCLSGDCDLTLQNSSGGGLMLSVVQPGCCEEPNQTICEDGCKSYLTDTANCGGCGVICGPDEICSDGACKCPDGQTQCGDGCLDLSSDPLNCGSCGGACGIDEFCSGGDCMCPSGRTQCGDGCFDLQGDDANCGSCDNVCGSDQLCSAGACDCSDPDQSLCGGTCFNLQDDAANCGACGNVCGVDEFCSGGACMCPAGQSQCGDGCFDLQGDDTNCGTCDNVCAADQFCSTGACDCNDPGRTVCDGTCVDLQTDGANCGSCGNACGPEDFCGEGTCQPICTGLMCGDDCIDPGSDPDNCGGCGNACAPDEMCSGGACMCPAGETQCGGGCFNLQSDDTNCGGCGNVCPGDQFCSTGACECNDPGETICDGTCLNLQTDSANCGGCGNVCGIDEFCSGGVCMCPAGQTQCGDGCFDLQTDPSSCGACGTVCGADQFCSAGACACSDPGQTACGGVCVHAQDDPLNCGACGNVCGSNQICTGGSCSQCTGSKKTACDNVCVNIHTDPFNCGGCGHVCDFSSCPSQGQGTCSMGDSCICTDPTSTGQALSSRPIASDSPGKLKQGSSSKQAQGRSTEMANVIHSTPVQRNATASSVASAITVEVAPVCDVPEFQQMIPDGGAYVQTTGSGRIGKEVQVSVSIQGMDGQLLAQGPCPVIVPLTDIDTSGVILTASSVVTLDSSGDGLCQPTEDHCNYMIELKNVGDSSCVNPLATLSSPPDQFNDNELILLNPVSTYPNLPAYPGDGIILEGKMNQVAFSVTSTADQASDVGRPFLMSVLCQNLPDPVEMPIVLGFGSACTPDKIDGETYDHLNGFVSPVNAALVPQGAPVNFSNGNFNHGSTIPFKMILSCGNLVLTDAQINPNPSVVALEHLVLGPQPLTGINGKSNANPSDPQFSCNDLQCDYQFRTEDLPIGTYIISVKMPDSRVFQAGFTIKP